MKFSPKQTFIRYNAVFLANHGFFCPQINFYKLNKINKLPEFRCLCEVYIFPELNHTQLRRLLMPRSIPIQAGVI